MELVIAFVCFVLLLAGIMSNINKKKNASVNPPQNGRLATIDDTQGIISIKNVKMMDDTNTKFFETLKTLLDNGKEYDDTDVEQNVAMNAVIHNPMDKHVIEPMRIAVTTLEPSVIKPSFFALKEREICYMETQHTMLYQCEKPIEELKKSHSINSNNIRSVKYITKGTLSITNKRIVLVEDDTYRLLSYWIKEFEAYACVDENAIILIKKGDTSLIYNFLLNLKLLEVPQHIASQWRFVIDCTRSRAIKALDKVFTEKRQENET